jgi:hypothetical protein
VKYLVANHADLYAKDLRGFTPVDTALGKSDGHGRNAGQFIAHEQTAALLKQLMASAPRAGTAAAPVRLARDQI